MKKNNINDIVNTNTTIINKQTGKTMIELVKELNNGVTIEYVIIDGIKCGVAGYTSDTDREKFIDTMQKIVDNYPNLSGMLLCMKVAEVLNSAAAMHEAGVENEELNDLTVDGEKYLVSLSKKKVYDKDFTEVADFSEFGDMSEKAALKVCEMLVKQAK